MWIIQSILGLGPNVISCSDGLPVCHTARGGMGTSYRLIILGQGFLDITDLCDSSTSHRLDLNGKSMTHEDKESSLAIDISLTFRIPFHFTATVTLTKVIGDEPGISLEISGRLKPLPYVDQADVTFINEMISGKFVPYQNIPGAPGKTVEEIKTLGLQLFPFTPYSFQLAMMVYDWTTASFVRIVLMKVFEYTRVKHNPPPLDYASIVEMIWQSDWGSYNPRDADYMRTFLMTPATSLEDIRTQFERVGAHLHRLSTIQNRLLNAAFYSLPRTSCYAKKRLFSGQVDIFQLGMNRFGVEFDECPLNHGPVGAQLILPFEATAGFMAPGKVVTTKAIWSFTDNLQDALHYSNGILLVVNPAIGSQVWDTASYITPLSDDPQKTEYTFASGTQFVVQSIFREHFQHAEIVVINLQTLVRREYVANDIRSCDIQLDSDPYPGLFTPEHFREGSRAYTSHLERLALLHLPFKLQHKPTGQWCRCIRLIQGAARSDCSSVGMKERISKKPTDHSHRHTALRLPLRGSAFGAFDIRPVLTVFLIVAGLCYLYISHPE